MRAYNQVEETIQVRSANVGGHLGKVGQWLSEERRSNNRRFVDIELNMNGQKDYMHSAVAYAHSSSIRGALSRQRPPISINMHNLRPRSVFKVVDWMYLGHTEFHKQHIGEYLAVTAFLAVDELHRMLEQELRKMSQNDNYRVHCLNLAADQRYRISPNTQRTLVLDVARSHDALSTDEIRKLSVRGCGLLLYTLDVAFEEKIDLINLVLLWFRSEDHVQDVSILNSLRIPNISQKHCHDLITHLHHRIQNTDTSSLSVYGRNNNTVVVSKDPKKFMINSGVLLHPTSDNNVEDTASAEICERKMEQSAIKEIQNLPDFNRKPSRQRSCASFSTGLVSEDETFVQEWVKKNRFEPSAQEPIKNPRELTQSELEDFKRLPPSAEVFKPVPFSRPKKNQSKPGKYPSETSLGSSISTDLINDRSHYFYENPSDRNKEKKFVHPANSVDDITSEIDYNLGLVSPKQSNSSSNIRTGRERIHKSAVEEINKIPDVFQKKKNVSESSSGSTCNSSCSLESSVKSSRASKQNRGRRSASRSSVRSEFCAPASQVSRNNSEYYFDQKSKR